MQQSTTPDPITTLVFRIDRAEREIGDLKTQLNLYVPTRENELRLQSINVIVQRIEQDVKDFKTQLSVLATQFQEQKEAQDKLLIRILWGTISIVVTILTLVLVGYITHFFH